MHPNPEKPGMLTPQSGENPEIIVDDVSWADRFLASSSLGGPLSAPFGDPQGGDINNDDLKDVQPYPVELWPETRPIIGRSSSGEQLYPYQVAVVLGRGKLAKIEVALTKWEEY